MNAATADASTQSDHYRKPGEPVCKTSQAPDGSRRITWWNGSEWITYGTDVRGSYSQHGDEKWRWNGNRFAPPSWWAALAQVRPDYAYA